MDDLSTRSNRRTLYVGGLEANVTTQLLYAAFVPFGPISRVDVPVDFRTQRSKGHGFVVFEEEEDAKEAVDNMHDSELYGRVLKVNISKNNRLGGDSSKPIIHIIGWVANIYYRIVWSEQDSWNVPQQEADEAVELRENKESGQQD